MRPYDEYPEDFDDFEEFAYRRSQALHRLVNEARREERQRNHRRDFSKDHRHRDRWDWGDDDDWNSRVDESGADTFKGLNGHY